MSDDPCVATLDGSYGQPLHIAAIFVVLVASGLGAIIPLLAKHNVGISVPPFYICLGKCAGTGVILSCALIHMLQPSNEALTSACVPTAFNTDYTAYAYLFALIAAFMMHWVEANLALWFGNAAHASADGVAAEELCATGGSVTWHAGALTLHGSHGHSHGHVHSEREAVDAAALSQKPHDHGHSHHHHYQEKSKAGNDVVPSDMSNSTKTKVTVPSLDNTAVRVLSAPSTIANQSVLEKVSKEACTPLPFHTSDSHHGDDHSEDDRSSSYHDMNATQDVDQQRATAGISTAKMSSMPALHTTEHDLVEKVPSNPTEVTSKSTVLLPSTPASTHHHEHGRHYRTVKDMQQEHKSGASRWREYFGFSKPRPHMTRDSIAVTLLPSVDVLSPESDSNSRHPTYGTADSPKKRNFFAPNQITVEPSSRNESAPPRMSTTAATSITPVPPSPQVLMAAAKARSIQQMGGVFMIEFGVTVHSIFIGLAAGVAKENDLKALLVALCFHQFFEGVALGSRLSDVEIVSFLVEAILILVFSIAASIGLSVGVGLTTALNTSGGSFLLVSGTFDGLCSGLLLFLGFSLLLRDFPEDVKRFCGGDKPTRADNWRRNAMFLATWVGAGGMALIGRWL